MDKDAPVPEAVPEDIHYHRAELEKLERQAFEHYHYHRMEAQKWLKRLDEIQRGRR